jgi:predicted transcriptional regulator
MAQKGRSAGSIARERIMAVVKTNPGIHVRRISLITGLSWSTCLHHLRFLDKAHEATSRKVQGKLCWFDSRQGALQTKTGICLLRDATNQVIADQIVTTPGTSQIHIARTLGLAASVVHRRMVAFEGANLVHRVATDRCMLVVPTDQLAKLLEVNASQPAAASGLIAPLLTTPVAAV